MSGKRITLRREVRNDALIAGINCLVKTERLFAIEEYGAVYTDLSEGRRAVQEELNEVQEEVCAADNALRGLYASLGVGTGLQAVNDAIEIQQRACSAAIEAVHLAAAADKLRRMLTGTVRDEK